LRSTCVYLVGVVAHGQDHFVHIPDHGSDLGLFDCHWQLEDRPMTAKRFGAAAWLAIVALVTRRGGTG
jgi:hypothetical protein